MSMEEPTVLISITNSTPDNSSPENFNSARNLENKQPITNMSGKSPSKQADANVQSRPNPLKVFSSRASVSARQQDSKSLETNDKDAATSPSSTNEKTIDPALESFKIVPIRPPDIPSLAKTTFDYSNDIAKQTKQAQNSNNQQQSVVTVDGKEVESLHQQKIAHATKLPSSQVTTVSISSVLSEANKNGSIPTEEEKGWIESYCFPFRENNQSTIAATTNVQFETVEINEDVAIGGAELPSHIADEMLKQDAWILFQEMRKAKEKELVLLSIPIGVESVPGVDAKTKRKNETRSSKRDMNKKSSLISENFLQPPKSYGGEEHQRQSKSNNELKVKVSLKRPAATQSDQVNSRTTAQSKKKKAKTTQPISQAPHEKPVSSAATNTFARKASITRLDGEELDAHLRRIFNAIEMIRRVLFPQCLSTADPRPKPSPELAASWWNACCVVLNGRNEPGALAIMEEVLGKFQAGLMNHAGVMVTVAGALACEDRLILGFDMFLPTGLSMAYILAFIKVLQATLVFLDRSLIHNQSEMIRLVRKGVVELSSALQSSECADPRVLSFVKSSAVSYEDEVALLALKSLDPTTALIGWIDLFDRRFGKGSEYEKQCETVLKMLQTLSDASISMEELSKLFSKVLNQIPDNAFRLSFQGITQRFLKLETQAKASSSSAAADATSSSTMTTTTTTTTTSSIMDS